MNISAKPLLIMGPRPYALEVVDVVKGSSGWETVGFIENLDIEKRGQKLAGLPIHWIDDISPLANDHWALCSLATTTRDDFIKQVSNQGFRFATTIHDTAYISQESTIGQGTRIGIAVIVAAYTNIGQHVSLNRRVTIGHHTQIGDYCTIQPCADIAGNCTIGDHIYIGMNAVVLDGITIGQGCIVGAGAVVTKNLPDHVKVMGIPAKIIEENIDGK